MSPALQASLPKMGFVRTLPKVLVHAPKAVGGMGINNLWHLQHLKQLHYMLGEIHRNSIAKKLIVAPLEEIVLESGLGPNTWEWPIN